MKKTLLENQITQVFQLLYWEYQQLFRLLINIKMETVLYVVWFLDDLRLTEKISEAYPKKEKRSFKRRLNNLFYGKKSCYASPEEIQSAIKFFPIMEDAIIKIDHLK